MPYTESNLMLLMRLQGIVRCIVAQVLCRKARRGTCQVPSDQRGSAVKSLQGSATPSTHANSAAVYVMRTQ